MTDPHVSYALVGARIELRLAELRDALDRHEAARRWDKHATLEHVEHGLAALARLVGAEDGGLRRTAR